MSASFKCGTIKVALCVGAAAFVFGIPFCIVHFGEARREQYEEVETLAENSEDPDVLEAVAAALADGRMTFSEYRRVEKAVARQEGERLRRLSADIGSRKLPSADGALEKSPPEKKENW